ncbi:MAG: hypothetical protein H6721_09540 [Sandaracinus sp.]|nr:hypothetical protein [Sandaracinus sp.]MCB9620615.1 hypothetical protein [Sandaracinus sp.]MCB9632356.1 hypothetical protein [Sandaracinus sp.]
MSAKTKKLSTPVVSAKTKKLSTPVVLALASLMICVGLLGFLWNRTVPAPTAPTPDATDLLVDTSTPERTAESFLDAWRKRAHELAEEMSEGVAREAVITRRRRDEALSPEERDLKRQLWDSLAADRLQLRLNESERLEDDALALRGIAEGTFLDRPYERRMEIVVVEREGGWKVRSFAFGEILSDVPSALLED